ncbi:MAG: DUF3566 domain-containing protein [Nitriliruptorales bacterium]
MARRKMTLRRVDPWTVLKFGFVLNLCLLTIALVGFGVVWFVIGTLGLIDQACQLATDVGFESCGVDGANLFRLLLLLGGLWTVIQTALMVFGAFLYNLLADLVGGIGVTVLEEGSVGLRADVARRRAAETRAGDAAQTRSGSATEGKAGSTAADGTAHTPTDDHPPRDEGTATAATSRTSGSDERDEDPLFGP